MGTGGIGGGSMGLLTVANSPMPDLWGLWIGYASSGESWG